MSWFWRHKKKKEAIIKQSCYDKLPVTHRPLFERVNARPSTTIIHTHEVVQQDDDSFLLGAVIGMEAENIALSYQTAEMVAEQSNPSHDFGGGDTGGGGAVGGWGTPDNSSSDNSSSYDSGSSSSSDSSSSYDSGSSSSYDSSSSSSDSSY